MALRPQESESESDTCVKSTECVDHSSILNWQVFVSILPLRRAAHYTSDLVQLLLLTQHTLTDQRSRRDHINHGTLVRLTLFAASTAILKSSSRVSVSSSPADILICVGFNPYCAAQGNLFL